MLIDFGSASYIKNGPFDVFVGTIGRFHLPVCYSSAGLRYPFSSLSFDFFGRTN